MTAGIYEVILTAYVFSREMFLFPVSGSPLSNYYNVKLALNDAGPGMKMVVAVTSDPDPENKLAFYIDVDVRPTV